MSNKYLASLGLGIKDALEYRANFFLSLISVLFPIFVQVFLWINLFSDKQGGALFGYTFAEMLAYVLYANLISRLNRTYFEYEINRDIKEGTMSVFLVKPVSYFYYRFFLFFGQKIAQGTVIILLVVSVSVFMLFSFGKIIHPAYALISILSLGFAFVINFAIFFCVGMLGFWLDEIGFLFEAARIVILVFSGGVFPLEIFGGQVTRVLSLLPFSYVIYFPTKILCGNLALHEVFYGITIQFFWAIAASIFAMRLFSIGSKRYSAAGG